MISEPVINSYVIRRKKAKVFISLVVSFFYALVLAIIPNDFFRDRYNYSLYADRLSEIQQRFSIETFFFNEPLFYYINKFLYVFFSAELIPKLFVFFIAFSISYLLIIYSRNIFNAVLGLLLLFFVSYTFHLQLVVLRQGVATALLLWFVYYYWDNKKVFYPICFLLSLIHVSFFIVFFIIFIDYFLSCYFKNIKFRIVLIALMLLASSFSMVQLAASLGVRQVQSEGYLSTTEGGGGGFILFSFVLVFILLRGPNNVYRNKFGRIAILGIVAYLSFYYTIPVSGRIIATFIPFLYIYTVSSTNWKVLLSVTVFLMVNIYLFTGSISDGSLTPVGVNFLNSLF